MNMSKTPVEKKRKEDPSISLSERQSRYVGIQSEHYGDVLHAGLSNGI